MRQKNIILAARLLSMMFTPFYLSTVGLIVLFTFSYLSLAPWQYKLRVIGMVYLFTILMPTLLIRFYRQYHGWTLLELGRQEKRMVPYVISILCYASCYTLMEITHIPHFMSIILMAALAIQMCCVVINIWWKIFHTHIGHWRRGRSAAGLCRALQFQPLVVALPCVHRGRNGGYQPNDPATTHALAGGGRISRWTGRGVHSHHAQLSCQHLRTQRDTTQTSR